MSLPDRPETPVSTTALMTWLELWLYRAGETGERLYVLVERLGIRFWVEVLRLHPRYGTVEVCRRDDGDQIVSSATVPVQHVLLAHIGPPPEVEVGDEQA